MRFLNKGKWMSCEKTAIPSGNQGLSLRSLGLLASRARLLYSLALTRRVSTLPVRQARRRVQVTEVPAPPERPPKETNTSRDAGSKAASRFNAWHFRMPLG